MFPVSLPFVNRAFWKQRWSGWIFLGRKDPSPPHLGVVLTGMSPHEASSAPLLLVHRDARNPSPLLPGPAMRWPLVPVASSWRVRNVPHGFLCHHISSPALWAGTWICKGLGCLPPLPDQTAASCLIHNLAFSMWTQWWTDISIPGHIHAALQRQSCQLLGTMLLWASVFSFLKWEEQQCLSYGITGDKKQIKSGKMFSTVSCK